MTKTFRGNQPSKQKQNLLALDTLKEILDYNPITGLFTWKIDRKGGSKAGDVAGCHQSGYIYIKINYKLYAAHRLAWFFTYGQWPSEIIDHIDNNSTNNQILNLREASHSENMRNKKTYANNKTGYKGVSLNQSSGKFQAKIRVDGKQFSLGYYSTAEEAHKAYVEAANKHFGEFARAA